MYDEGETDKARQLELDSVEEACCTALIQSARYLQGIRRYHDRNVKERSFSIGDLVLRRIQDESGPHKLNSRWEGRSSSSRLQGQGPIEYNVPRVRMFRTPGTSRTCASSTHKKIPSIAESPGA
jgi:hypothetical protein